MAGYEADEASQTCEACPVGRFNVSIIEKQSFLSPLLISPNNTDLYNRIILIICL